MTLAQQMFALAPAIGQANLSAGQEELLVGKAFWLHEASRQGFGVVPTICLTRAAWDGLQAERGGRERKLRTHWVATLFKLVGRHAEPPGLVVRTSAANRSPGLMPARTGLPAPRNEAESVDPARPLARAISEAFASYGPADAQAPGRQIVIVQAHQRETLRGFVTRDPQTGVLGPIPMGQRAGSALPASMAPLIAWLDGVAGGHMTGLVSLEGDAVRLVSVRPSAASAAAELEAAVDRVSRGSWTRMEAVRRTDPARLPQLLHPRLKSDHAADPIAQGLGVSPGAASGVIVFTAEDAARMRARGRHCILVVTETGPTDIDGMKAATGILTARGGMTSHAAVVARITGKPCVAGVRTLSVNLGEMICRIGDKEFHVGDRLTIDGTDGTVYLGAMGLSQPHIGGAMSTLLGWSDASRTIAVRTNVETVDAARTALSFGAEGIGLARSEHMFFSRERMVALRRMILSEDEEQRAAALRGLVDFQTGDYADIFATMRGRPVTVRLFDPPLHEFLPRTDEDIEETAVSLGFSVRALRQRLERLAEVNPMLGHRGCRLAITYPEILEMQMQALMSGIRAASRAQAEPVRLEVMVPFVSTASEVLFIRERVMAILEAADIPAESREAFAFGTMIELPRAALRAGEIARSVDFFSFGTNDLTQTTFGISRDDAPTFLAPYQRKGIYEYDPFVTLDERGVGELIAIAIERGKAANPGLKIGICGEHAGDPASLKFLAGLGIDYVSCSPYRVPVARLTLAQATQNPT
ncbi:pyruvate, phosphate dikinase [Arsenicitalea aurantiaca]|uniref:Pyruvate, phosphate dikinase n=1 Tax=Arsenicitalea aurantiaca TaxID=1783274 RepID=A0A433XAP0_9HYPH|nr:putative PEP-binding protein [Arsenicitalea aurantiaca]RUT31133.1 pyruvate, phosphate dikinase [Arsenicitalea aurantiaca]